ncbi:MAG: PQQ-dependent sugar dehydrogenase [Aquimonas sp.]|nr:PQQ-dependent sugar dehydrogenase [Aquimonas sp.]
MPSLLKFALMCTWLLGATVAAAVTAQPSLELRPVFNGLSQPLYLTHAGDASGRIFIVQQRGRILVGRDGEVLDTPFLDLDGQLSGDSEQGLLGLAFAPDYASSGRFYVYYTRPDGTAELARYRVGNQPDRADASSKQVLLSIPQPFANHNGGWIGFGPDGFLYVASGDGGSSNDPQNHGQRLDSLLGKVLRLDVSGSGAAIPADNPFVGQAGRRGEIWAYGLRNPWRASFDRVSGDLWIADVGQQGREEVNFQRAGSNGGANYGWRTLEGSQCLQPGCTTAGTVLPVTEYGRALGCSITGGYVYRGSRYPALTGTYVFGDFCSGRIFGLRRVAEGSGADAFVREELDATGMPIASFGEDEAGNLYLVSYSGTVYSVAYGDAVDSAAIGRGHTGTWYDPAQNGHGLFIEVLAGNLVVAYWFTFDSQGRQAWFGGVGSIEGRRARVAVSRAEGGRFVPEFDPNQVSFPPLGHLYLEFESCLEGRVAFDLGQGFGRGSMRLQRLTVPLGAECP